VPGRFFLATELAEIAAALDLAPPEGAAGPARYNIVPGQEIAVISAQGLSQMRWGIIPVGRRNARGRPVMDTIVNARGETIFEKSAFAGMARAVVPADGWYEWTGRRGHKTAWRIRRKDRGLLWFAAICETWHGPGGAVVPQVATVTCEPNADLRPIHDRMSVILDRQAVGLWIHGTEAEAQRLVAPLAEGLLEIDEARDVDWTSP